MTRSPRHHAVELVRLGMDVIADPMTGPSGADIVTKLNRLRGSVGRQQFDQIVATLVLIGANFASDHPDRELRLGEWLNHPLLNGGGQG